MDNHFRGVLFRFLKMVALLSAGTVLLSYFWFYSEMGAILLAHTVSLLFVGSIFAVVRNIRKQSHKTFYRHFLIIFSLRFVLVVGVLTLILMITKFHQIYFTVSFIISYILHSVIEIFSINQILQTDN